MKLVKRGKNEKGFAGESDIAHSPIRNDTIPALDGIRAVAALLVLTTHVAFSTGFVQSPGIGALAARMDFGVCLFFLLSGFLLYRPWARKTLANGSPPKTRVYLRRRFGRIYPAYAALVAVVLGWYATDADVTVEKWVRYLTFTQVYEGGYETQGLTQVWSLATEVSFYLALPFLAWLVGRLCRTGDVRQAVRAHVIVFVLMVAAATAFTVIRTNTDWIDGYISSSWLPGYLDWFAAGMGLAALRSWLHIPSNAGPRDRVAAVAGDWVSWVTAGVVLFIASATPIAGALTPFDRFSTYSAAGPWAVLWKHWLYLAAALCFMVPVVLSDRPHHYQRAMSSRPMLYLGKISYGIFLWHLLVLELLREALGLTLFSGGMWYHWPLTIVATVVAAQLSWWILEQPAIRWAHRSGPRQRRRRLSQLRSKVRSRGRRAQQRPSEPDAAEEPVLPR
jgi:peptidoglycan/LPS O-acetylase OafA/YrhL